MIKNKMINPNSGYIWIGWSVRPEGLNEICSGRVANKIQEVLVNNITRSRFGLDQRIVERDIIDRFRSNI